MSEAALRQELATLKSELAQLRSLFNSMKAEADASMGGGQKEMRRVTMMPGGSLPAPTENYQVLTADMDGWSEKAPEGVVAWVPDVVRATATDTP